MKILFYPTAIGSEPPNPAYSSYPHWARVMQGHAGANMVRPRACCCACCAWGGVAGVAVGVRLLCTPHRSDAVPPPACPLCEQMPVVASNRIGTERFDASHITFYGGSFIAGPAGEIVAQVGWRAIG